MYMGVIGNSPESEILRELAGTRVLVTGLARDIGVDIARAFADVKCRLAVQTNDLTPDMTALVAVLSQSAAELKLYTDPVRAAEPATRFAQNCQQAFGGLDTVVNLQTITRGEMRHVAGEADVERLITAKLTPLTHITRVCANRMRVIFAEGLILNVLTMPAPEGPREAAIAGIARTALAAMTRGEAGQWADQSVRINCIAPKVDPIAQSGASLKSEPDIAALALYLASRRGRTLSSHIFDADLSSH
ncbi:MAG TPA: SDR family NAD(P)-dependent oxidoreductase [Hyphomicrobium sp.]|nr:SDR family NAD(P)-dependent oxidoreductase [Hyphomicrobium sp.]